MPPPAANGRAIAPDQTDCRSVMPALMNQAEMGGNRKGLFAIYYQIEAELPASHPLGRADSHTRLLPDRALHLRVPSCGTPEESRPYGRAFCRVSSARTSRS